MTAEEWLKKTYKKDDKYNVRSRVKCKDGLELSIQGGTSSHYCTPRKHCDSYFEVEIGFPSRPLYSLKKYAENKSKLTETVYGYVPIKELEQVIKRHGGIVWSRV